MSEHFIGHNISVELAGNMGFYQGKVTSVNSATQTIAISKVIHNGKPSGLSEVTINAQDIKDLKILSEENDKNTRNSPAVLKTQPQAQITPQTQKPTNHGQNHQATNNKIQQNAQSQNQHQQIETQPGRRKHRTSVGETLAHGSHNSRANEDYNGYNYNHHHQEYSSPRRNDRYNDQLRYQQNNSRTPNKREVMRQVKDDKTFGEPIDHDEVLEEFDFEKNLALFDKQATREEIQIMNGGSIKPDVVKGADRFTEKKYRHDENVLGPSKPKPKTQITVPADGAGEVIYATDNGLLVPSITSAMRSTLLSTANQNGLTNSRQLEMIGRATTELILSQIGGSHRLEPGNSHQSPVVVFLCGFHSQGAAGVNTARQLECHGVRTHVVTPQLPSTHPAPLVFTHELQLYSLTNGRHLTDARNCPSILDLIVDARLDHNGTSGEGGVSSSWLSAASTFASNYRAPILALDPPSDLVALPNAAASVQVNARVLLCPALPLAYTPGKGKLYLLNMPIPIQTFTAVGIKYSSPFGAKLVIPLHPCE